MTLQPIPSELSLYEENFIFLFISLLYLPQFKSMRDLRPRIQGLAVTPSRRGGGGGGNGKKSLWGQKMGAEAGGAVKILRRN
jgi:hypothetical protein